MSKVIDLRGKIDVFIITNGRSTFPFCEKTVNEQVGVKFSMSVHRDTDWLTSNKRMFEVSEAKYCLRVDDDMFLNNNTLRFMWYCLKNTSDKVALRGWRLWEPWSNKMCKGIKVYNRKLANKIGLRIDNLGKVDKPYTSDAEKKGYKIEYSRDMIAIHAAGRFEEHVKYWEMRGESKGPEFKKKLKWAKESMKKYNLSLEEQYAMTGRFIINKNKENNTEFGRFLNG